MGFSRVRLRGDAVRRIATWAAGGAILAAPLVGALPAYAQAAATLTVAPTGSDSATCGASASPCKSIEQAVTNAAAGSTIVVQPGSYSASLTAAGGYSAQVIVDKSLTIESASTGGAVLSGPGPVFLLLNPATPSSGVSGVTIRGFAFTNVTGHGYNGVISVPGYGASDVTITNNTFTNITDEAIGDHANPGLSSNWTITGNTVNGVTGTRRSGFWLGNLSNATVQNNQISNTTYAGMILNSVQSATVASNTVKSVPDHGIEVGYTPNATPPSGNVTLNGNTITDANTTSVPDFGAIDVYPNESHITISNNSLTNSYNGVDVRALSGTVGADVIVSGNNLGGNSNAGVQNAAQGGGPLPAPENYWGCAGGPGTPGCSGVLTVSSEPSSKVVVAVTLSTPPTTGQAPTPPTVIPPFVPPVTHVAPSVVTTPVLPIPLPIPAPVPTSVGSTGGTLTTADGIFTLPVAAGLLTGSHTLSVTELAKIPVPLPAGALALSPAVRLTGTGLARAAVATIAFRREALHGLSPYRVSVYRILPTGGWAFVPTAVFGQKGKVIAFVPGPETLAVLARTATFKDVPASAWFAPYVDIVVGAGVMRGFPNGTFQPDAALNRAEFVQMLDLTLGLQPRPGASAFRDVPADAWFAPYVNAAVHAGIVQGVSATSFAPGAPVTREEMAVLLARALHLQGGGTPAFADAATIAPWARAAVSEVAKAGYLTGQSAHVFAPTAPTTRVVAARAFALVIRHMAP